MAVVLLYGFSCGLPLALTGQTLQTWMADVKVDLTVIGIFSLVGLPYTLKFAWAPLLDRYMPPLLGRRRGWILIAQIGLILAISAMAFTNPLASPAALAFFAFLVAFFSASQDIVVDAYRAELLPAEELGAGTGIYIMGYRLAMLVSGGLALILADHMPWGTVLLLVAATMSVGVVTSLLAPEPKVKAKPPKSLREAVVEPLVDFFSSKGALEILLFILLYKLGDVVAGMMTSPFLVQLGFTKTVIGSVYKVTGMVATIVGGLAGGAVLYKIGIKRSLWIFGIIQCVSNLAFMVLAQTGQNYSMLVTAVAIENLSGGMGTAAFTAFMMSLCNKSFTATQYALLSSLMAVARVFIGAPTGYLAKSVGWEQYFLISALLAIPGLLMLLRYNAWDKATD